MDFSSMGQLDAESEIEKGAIHSSDVKNATIRVSNDYLSCLTSLLDNWDLVANPLCLS